MGLSLRLCAVPLLQFRSQRSEEVRLECQSKRIAQTMIKAVNDKEGTNSRCWGQEGFIPNRQEDARHDEETRSLSKSIFKLKYRRVNEGYLYERENCGNAGGTRFQGSVPELQKC